MLMYSSIKVDFKNVDVLSTNLSIKHRHTHFYPNVSVHVTVWYIHVFYKAQNAILEMLFSVVSRTHNPYTT